MSMVSIVRYSTRAGPDNQLIHRISHDNIKLKNHGVTFVDLSGITKMENLQRVDIANNRLERVDLSPLSECKELRYLDISENKIREIDLSPLEACKHLERLDLSHNMLATIDISPLYNCTELKYLYLHYNSIKRLDATVLLNCPNIEQLTLTYGGTLSVGHIVEDENGITYFGDPLLDYAIKEKKPSWLNHEKMAPVPKKQNYSWLVRKYGWQRTKRWMLQISKILGESHGYPLQLELLKNFGIPELACFDGSFEKVVQMLPDQGSFRKGLEIFRGTLLEVLYKQLENKGSTLFFDIDILSTQDASILIPQILKRRKKELDKVKLLCIGQSIDLTPLWKTGYGYEILRALGLKKRIHKERFLKVKKALAEIGVKVSLTHDPKVSKKYRPPTLSTTLCKFIIPEH